MPRDLKFGARTCRRLAGSRASPYMWVCLPPVLPGGVVRRLDDEPLQLRLKLRTELWLVDTVADPLAFGDSE